LLQEVNCTWSFYMVTQSDKSFLCGMAYISFILIFQEFV
jgi:hypothetical protein